MTIFNWLTLIFWLILILYWLISALRAKKSVRPRLWWLRELGLRLTIWAIVLFLIYTGRLRAFRHFSSGFFHQSTATTPAFILLGVLGVILCAAGIAFAIWARVYLGRNWGLPMTLQEGHELVTSGPYAFVRHPIYAGFLVAMLGTVFADGIVWLAVLLVFGIYFVYSAKTEEKIMLKQFPNEYPAYVKRTKTLIPFVW